MYERASVGQAIREMGLVAGALHGAPLAPAIADNHDQRRRFGRTDQMTADEAVERQRRGARIELKVSFSSILALNFYLSRSKNPVCCQHFLQFSVRDKSTQVRG